METCPKLTPTQALLLRAAARRADGRVIPPDTLRGGARVKVMTSLLQRGWIEPAGRSHALTDAGYAMAGRQRPAPVEDGQPVNASDALQLLARIPLRPGSKLAALVAALGHPNGARSEPAIIQAILPGKQPRCMSLLWLQRNPLPIDWAAQREMVARFDA